MCDNTCRTIATKNCYLYKLQLAVRISKANFFQTCITPLNNLGNVGICILVKSVEEVAQTIFAEFELNRYNDLVKTVKTKCICKKS